METVYLRRSEIDFIKIGLKAQIEDVLEDVRQNQEYYDNTSSSLPIWYKEQYEYQISSGRSQVKILESTLDKLEQLKTGKHSFTHRTMIRLFEAAIHFRDHIATTKFGMDLREYPNLWNRMKPCYDKADAVVRRLSNVTL